MFLYILLVTIQCGDGFSMVSDYPINNQEEVDRYLESFEKNNKVRESGHKKCYISLAEWKEKEMQEEPKSEF